MTLLATVESDLGRIEIHYIDGRFATCRTYFDEIAGAESVSADVEDAQAVVEWYQLARDEGEVHLTLLGGAP